MKTENKYRFRTLVKLLVAFLAAAAVSAMTVVSYFTAVWLASPSIYPTESLVHRILIYSSLFPFAFVVALLHALILGTPALLLGLRLHAIHWWSCAIVGFVIGATPFSISSIAMSIANFELKDALPFGFLGIIGGLTFWFLWNLWIQNEFKDNMQLSIPKRNTT